MMATMAAKRKERLMRLEQERLGRKKKAEKHFSEFDNGTGKLDKAGLKGLLELMFQKERGPVGDDGVDYVHHTLYPDDPEAQMDVSRVDQMNRAYVYWASKEETVENIFVKHDTDKSGLLNKDQLRAALIDVETANADKRAYDHGDWTITEMELTDEIIAIITENADWNHDGQISKSESLAALTLWSALAKEEAKKRRSSTVCVIA